MNRGNTRAPKYFREGIRYDLPSGNINSTDQLLSQLVGEGIASYVENAVLITWQDIYTLFKNDSYVDSLCFLALPAFTNLRPVLNSSLALSDPAFAVSLSGFIDSDGKKTAADITIVGGMLTTAGIDFLMPEMCWKTVEAIAAFHNRTSVERSAIYNQKAWSNIRKWAIEARAELSDYLRNTIILTPDKLKLILRRSILDNESVIEVTPTFEDAPANWLYNFDKFNEVQERYDILNGKQLVMIYPSAETIIALNEIKKMPGRRVAGNRAEAFIRNPFAILGPAAEKVLSPEQFEEARADAGIFFARFTAKVETSENGMLSVSLLIAEVINDHWTTAELSFKNEDDLERFVTKLSCALRDGAQMVFWDGFDLEILADTPDQHQVLSKALKAWKTWDGITLAEVLDLSRYTNRISEIGIEKAYYSPFIAKKEEGDGWFPDTVIFGVQYTPPGASEPITVQLDEERLSELDRKCKEAEKAGRKDFIFPGFEEPIPVDVAKDICISLGEAGKDVKKGNFDPTKIAEKPSKVKRKTLIIKPNIDKIDYLEVRGRLAMVSGTAPRIPNSLNPQFNLKEHQRSGVAWLQHLWSHSPADCRGAVLADDMGLGKTIQLLSLIARCFEDDETLNPVLVVAPVALLDNWKDEIEKFFAPGTLRVLRLYGDELAERRVSKSELEQELAQANITRLLRKNWVGNAQVVLTTYETLRDLEFSLAAQQWSIMICDEAQKIKNPNAMMTRAAKKQNARFKIACTGTPVENSLADIWCLYDFVQPGLLGALNTFGRTYRRPIEAKTEEEKEKVEELRAIIQPQILRRTKEEVAKDLPRKVMVGIDSHSDLGIRGLASCVSLPMTDRQRGLYAGAISHFKNTDENSKKIKNHLGLLQHLRRLCIDPRAVGQIATDFDSVTELEKHSPRLKWLFEALAVIRNRKEKAIIFCEMKDVQRLLQRCISYRFGIVPDFVNGDVSADSKHAGNRKVLISSFQKKDGFNVILLSPLAAGFGLNIQAANHVIHFSRSWNPAKEDQATDRAYRIGQEKEVFVYCPVIVAKEFTTFDAKLDKLLRYKRELSRDMLNGTGDVAPADFVDVEGIGGEPIIEDGPIESKDLDGLTGEALEALCVLLWGKMGFSYTYWTKGIQKFGDGGVDVVATNGVDGELLQCKSSTRDGKELGWDAIKEVVGGKAAYSVKHPGVEFVLVAVTNQYFNGTAKSQAELNNVKIIERPLLEKMLLKHKVMRMELEKMLLGV
ncbi:MAG: restriction endonuclease [Bdellovibrio sp.]|nr:restriction endonuclease [Bdellovibrio sp.]